MVKGSLARRWAKALFAIGEEQGNLLGLTREVQRVAETWAESEELRDSMSNPALGREARTQVWESVQRRLGATRVGRNFFMLLLAKGRLEELLADRGVGYPAGALDDVALAQLRVLAEEHDADVVLLEVEHHSHELVRELEQLPGHRVVEAVDAGDAVADREDGAGLHHLDVPIELLDLLFDDVADLFRSKLHLPLIRWHAPRGARR